MKEKFSFSILFRAMFMVLAVNALFVFFGADLPIWLEDLRIPKMLALLLIIPGAISGGVIYRMMRTEELAFLAGAATGATFQLIMWMLLPNYGR